MIWYDRCKSRVLSNVKKWRTISKKTRPLFFYFCVVKVCYKDVVGLLPCLRVKASICPFIASETFSSRWSRLPVLRFCERRESCEKIKRLLKKQWNMHGQHAFIEIIMLGTITAMSLWSWKRQFWKQYRHSSEVGNNTEHIVSNFKTSSGIGKCRQMKIYSLSFKLGVKHNFGLKLKTLFEKHCMQVIVETLFKTVLAIKRKTMPWWNVKNTE